MVRQWNNEKLNDLKSFLFQLFSTNPPHYIAQNDNILLFLSIEIKTYNEAKLTIIRKRICQQNAFAPFGTNPLLKYTVCY